MKKRIFTALLAAAVVFSTSLPIFASEKIGAQGNEATLFEDESDTNEKEWGGGGNPTDYQKEIITAFTPLEENVAKQELTIGSSEEIILPESLTAILSHSHEITLGQSVEETIIGESGVTSTEIPEEVLWFCDIYLQKEDGTFYLYKHSQMDWEKPGVEVSVSAADFDGMKTGWGEELGKDYVFDADNPDNVLTGTVSADGKTLLKVHYKLPSHKVIYAYEGPVPNGAPPLPAPDSVDVGEEFHFEEYPTYPGYIFENVHTNDQKVEINEEDHSIIMPDHDITIYGSWIKLHTVTFDPQGGKWSDGTAGNLIKQIPNNEMINEVLPILTKDSYTFGGWFTQPVGGEQYQFERPVTGDMTLYAHWEPLVQEVTVTFDENGGDTPANPNQMKLNQGTALNQLPIPPQKSGYVFREWNTQKDGSGDIFTETTIVEQDITVYAQWEKEAERPIIPEKPEKPVDPTDPTNPHRPHRPNRPENDGSDSDSVPMTFVRPQKEKETVSGNQTETAEKQQESSVEQQDKYNPSTGENAHVGLALAGMAVSCCAVLALCHKKD